jgi:hypothetical protein
VDLIQTLRRGIFRANQCSLRATQNRFGAGLASRLRTLPKRSKARLRPTKHPNAMPTSGRWFPRRSRWRRRVLVNQGRGIASLFFISARPVRFRLGMRPSRLCRCRYRTERQAEQRRIGSGRSMALAYRFNTASEEEQTGTPPTSIVRAHRHNRAPKRVSTGIRWLRKVVTELA